MVVARKIAYNVLVSSVCKVLSTVLALVSIGLITRYLGKEGFGNYATVLAFLSFFAAVADLGLYQISTREISRPGADERKIIGNIASLRIISAIIVFLAAPLVTMFFDYPVEVKRGILIVAASFLFSSGYQVLNGVFQKNLAMNKVAIVELFGKAIQVGVVILAVKLNLGFDWIMASLLFNMLLIAVVVFALSRRYVKFKLSFDFGYWKVFLRESLPMGAAAIITFAYFKMDTILLSVMKTGADVGIYNAAYKVLENITFFPAMIIGLVLPIFSHSIFSERQKFRDVADKTFKVFVILVVPLIVGTLFLADPVIRLIGGGGFSESVVVLRVLVFALGLIFFGHFFNALLIAGNQQKKLMMVLALAAGMNIVLNLIFIPKFSYLAAAYISVLTELVVASLTFFLAYREIKYYPRLENFFGILASGFLMAAFLFVFRSLNFFAAVLGSASVYFIFVWLFKVVKSSEITSIISREGGGEYEKLS
jgi:O-antigen/teichoic acid export membrane protein